MLLFAVTLLPSLHLVPVADALQADAVPDLILAAPAGATTQSAPGEDSVVVRSRSAEIQVGVLNPYTGSTMNRRVRLTLFDGASYVAQLTLTSSSGPGRTVWTGRVEGDATSSVVLAIRDGALAAEVRVGSAVYQVRSDGTRVHSVRQIDPRQFPAETTVVPQPGELRPDGGDQVASLVDSGSVIDVMVVYTGATRSAAGGLAAINSEIDLMIAVTNTAYANSGINPRLRLVHTEEVAYAETGNSGSDLGALRSSTDGNMDNVHALRNSHGADLVALIVESLEACGVGYLNTPTAGSASFGFSVVRRLCAAGNFSFAHELAHNMGANHDRAADNGGSASAFNYGYVSPTQRWRTIMAYPTSCNNCLRVGYFSNPQNTFLGEAMGVASGQPNGADNHLQLNNAAQTVANFRTSVDSSPPTQTATPLPPQPTATGTPTQTSTPLPSHTATVGLPTPTSQAQTPTTQPSSSATAQLSQSTVTRTATSSPTATVPANAVLGGKNIGIVPGVGSATVFWDGGTAQNGYLAARYLPSFELLQPSLIAGATSFAANGLATGALYCYIVGPTTGTPPSLAGVSNFVCLFANTRSGASAPQNITLRVTQAGNAELSWFPSPTGDQDAFRILRLNGSTIDLPGATLNRTFPLSGFDCFMVTALRAGIPIGNTDAVCALAGVSTLGPS